MKKSLLLLIGILILAVFTACGNGEASQETAGEKKDNTGADETKSSFVLATTTSTQDSGLLDELVPMFEEKHGYMVKTIAVGTGKALEMGENGEADALLTHAPAAEQVLVDNGDVTNYQLVMHNDFVIVGPAEDPAGIKGMKEPSEALKTIADSESVFVSRGDDSGTHKKEQSLWEEAGLQPEGQWYQETGQGMGGTIRVASEKSGYSLTDRATYLALQDELSLGILVEGYESLKNIYHVMQVNPDKSDKINSDAAKAFVDFMVSEEAQNTIEHFGVEEYGQPLFFPDAK